MAEEYKWIKVADFISDLPFAENGIAEVTVEGKKICMAKWQNQLFAFAHKCPHAGGFFINGYMDALGNVVCPLHRYKFCMENGRNSSGEGYYLNHWPVVVKENGVFIGLKGNKLWGWLS